MNARQVERMFAAMDSAGSHDLGSITLVADGAPTPEELEQEAAYYAWLENQMAAAAVVPDPVNFCDDDDCGYCGPTCGRFGNW